MTPGGFCRAGSAFGLLACLVAPSWGAAPPRSIPVLTPQQRKEIDRLDQQLFEQLLAGEFKTATSTAERILQERQRLQGSGHWETVEARRTFERWRQLSDLPADKSKQVGIALKKISQGNRLGQKFQYAEADRKLQEALEICRKVLGEMHSETASACTAAAFNLHAQGKYREADPLFREALQIERKTLGELHLNTATNLSNLAANLDDQGKYREAEPLYRQALAIRRKVLGPLHPQTATSCNNLGHCLYSQGKYREAEPLYQEALETARKLRGERHSSTMLALNNLAVNLGAQGKHREAEPLLRKVLKIKREALGERHRSTALSSSNLAGNLDAQGKYREAEALYHVVLDVFREVHGEKHPATATGYSNLGGNLSSQGKYIEAEALYRKAHSIFRQVLGEMHPSTATSLNNVAAMLNDQSKYGEAEPLYRKALEVRRKVLGGRHPDTAASYQSLASNLNIQGQYPEAELLYRKALEIRRRLLGEMHPETASSYASLALCLDNQGKYAAASRLFQKALEIRRQVRGEIHPDTASSYTGVAFNLASQDRHLQAEPFYRKALDIRRQALGEMHPLTMQSFNNVGFNLQMQGKYREAEPLLRKALASCRQVLGEIHLHTAQSYKNVAGNLYAQGKFGEAADLFRAAWYAEEHSRLRAATSGFDRALFRARDLSASTALASCLVRLKQPREAWLQAETGLALRLLDDLADETSEPAGKEDIARHQRLEQINRLLLPLLTAEKLSPSQQQERDGLLAERQHLEAMLAREAAQRSAKRVWPLERIQKQLPADAAILLPIDTMLGHWTCIVRSSGDPVWVALTGSGLRHEWTEEDNGLVSLTLRTLQDPSRDETARQRLLEQLNRQRLAPLQPLLGANGKLPAVRHLLMIPAGDMAPVPLEALTDRYRVSYIPCATVFARFMERHRPLKADSLLALGDPAFMVAKPRQPDPPAHGLLVRVVLPGGGAARAGLLPGDVLLSYDGTSLKTAADLHVTREPAPVVLWRNGKELTRRLPGGPLGASLDRRPAGEAVRAWWESSLASRGDKKYPPLPGTRLEVETLSKLVNNTIRLTGSAASEQSLRQLASSGKLKSFRLLHLATHGEANPASPDQTCLVLAQDKLPARLDDAVSAILCGDKPLDGRLTVGTIRKTWQLDADLVVLSACESGRGKETSSAGVLGFTQALLAKGARSVVLSRWKVDDSATTLLMLRFYENLLGKRDGLKQGMKRAEALQEAKDWLRTLSRREAERLVARLSGGVLRGTIGAAPPEAKGNVVKLPAGDRPYASPYYWSAFVLIGDPF
jgi:CHAT domain-containing protein/Tfp pilus assembly protein PilF